MVKFKRLFISPKLLLIICISLIYFPLIKADVYNPDRFYSFNETSGDYIDLGTSGIDIESYSNEFRESNGKYGYSLGLYNALDPLLTIPNGEDLQRNEETSFSYSYWFRILLQPENNCRYLWSERLAGDLATDDTLGGSTKGFPKMINFMIEETGGNSYYTAKPSTVINPSSWELITIVYNASNTDLCYYHNTSLDNCVDFPEDTDDFEGNLYLDSDNANCNISIDDLRFYQDYALTLGDIYNIYINNLTEPCYEDLRNTSITEWQNMTSCVTPYLSYYYQQNRSYTTYDANNCGETENTTYWEYLNNTCDLVYYKNDFKGDERMLSVILLNLVFTGFVIWLLSKGYTLAGIFIGFASFGLDLLLASYLRVELDSYIVTYPLIAIGSMIFVLSYPLVKAVILFTVYKRGY